MKIFSKIKTFFCEHNFDNPLNIGILKFNKETNIYHGRALHECKKCGYCLITNFIMDRCKYNYNDEIEHKFFALIKNINPNSETCLLCGQTREEIESNGKNK